mgnify:CR=1 FL=1
MMYAPHTLYVKREHPIEMDSFGKPVKPSEAEWVKVGVCRCDDDSTQELVSPNGQTYLSRYHVVYDRTDAISEGDEIRCVQSDGKVRGQGVVGRARSTNYLGYSELWT